MGAGEEGSNQRRCGGSCRGDVDQGSDEVDHSKGASSESVGDAGKGKGGLDEWYVRMVDGEERAGVAAASTGDSAMTVATEDEGKNHSGTSAGGVGGERSIC